MKIIKRIKSSVRFHLFSPKKLLLKKIKNTDLKLRRLGTVYGGWMFCDLPGLHGATIVSCGAGEDISFDIEMLRHYGVSIIIVDPTPRAVEHFSRVKGAAAKKGKLAINNSSEFYNLEGIDFNRVSWLSKALWKSKGKLRFYKPRDSAHVSHSLINLQRTTNYIEVETIKVSEILQNENITHLNLLKMDIDGAEIEVIQSLIDDRIFPDQILVEFDEMVFPNRKTKARVASAVTTLGNNGYSLVYFDGSSNCLFVKNTLKTS